MWVMPEYTLQQTWLWVKLYCFAHKNDFRVVFKLVNRLSLIIWLCILETIFSLKGYQSILSNFEVILMKSSQHFLTDFYSDA